MDNQIVPECYIDTMLVETLLPPNKRYNHQHGCFDVAREMTNKLKDTFAVGIVDDDKNTASYFRNFNLLASYENFLKLFRHEQAEVHHYLIVIVPAAENWILNVSALAGIDLVNFDLPATLKELRKITKPQTSAKDQRFISLFSEFKKSNHEIILTLINWISLLKERNYEIDINELKNGRSNTNTII